MAIELRGFDDLQNDMVNMAYALDQGPGVNRALKAGAVPIEEQMLHNASTDPKIITDALHSSIHTGKVKQNRGGGKQITIGVHHLRTAHITPILWSLGTAGLLRPPRILLCGLPLTPGPMRPFPKSSASCGTSSRTDELEVNHYG